MIRSVLILLAMTVPALAADDGLALWGKIHEVFAHPRCANCHVGPDRAPMWTGIAGRKDGPHGMNVVEGDVRSGSIPCRACHGKENAGIAHGPPGADVWKLAPVEMQWFGKTSAEICAQIKDPLRSKPDIAAVAEHVATDELVHWGWKPGIGRSPAPYSSEEVTKFLKAWADAGAPCPPG